MRESEDYQIAMEGVEIGKSYLDYEYDLGFTKGYTNCYEVNKEYLEWQNPEDVELVDGKIYIIKSKQLQYIFIGTFDSKNQDFTSFDLMYCFDISQVLIKKIEV